MLSDDSKLAKDKERITLLLRQPRAKRFQKQTSMGMGVHDFSFLEEVQENVGHIGIPCDHTIQNLPMTERNKLWMDRS